MFLVNVPSKKEQLFLKHFHETGKKACQKFHPHNTFYEQCSPNILKLFVKEKNVGDLPHIEDKVIYQT